MNASIKTLEHADARGLGADRVPDQHGSRDAENDQRNPLRRRVDMAKEDQLTTRPEDAKRERSEKQFSESHARVSDSRVAPSTVMDWRSADARHSSANDARRVSLRASLRIISEWNGDL